jgi:hypothetical protein
MRTYSRRRKARLVLAVATVAICLPELARAQQTGLFPLAPIRRQRIPCDMEDPVYKEHKLKYFGYHPTCWHTFPAGWGCPSAERPDRAKSFKDQPLEAEAVPGEGPQQAPETRPGLPAVPGTERSPFLLDRPDTTPGAAPGTPRTAPPARTPPPADDPFATPDQTPPAARPGGDAPAAPRSNGGPNLSPPADRPEQPAGPRASRDLLDEEPADESQDTPLLALPNINLPPVDDPGSIYEPKSVGALPAGAANMAPGAGPGVSPQPRRGLLSGLFSNLGLNWTRR